MGIQIADQFFDADDIEGVRQAVIGTRDAALETGRFDYAVPLSHAVAMLAHLRDQHQPT